MATKSCFVIILLYICLLFTCTGCRQERKRKTPCEDRGRGLVERLEKQLREDPVIAASMIDSLQPHIKDSLLYYRCLVLKSTAYMFMSRDDSAWTFLKEAEHFCASGTSKGRIALRASIRNMEGNLLSRQAKIDSARIKFTEAYYLYEKVRKKKKCFDVSLNLADACVREGKLDQGAFWYHRSLSFADSMNMPVQERFPSYYGLAQVYTGLHDFAQCDFYYEKAGSCYDSMRPYEKHTYLNNRGNSYYYRHDYKTALEYFRKSLNLVSAYPEMEFERNLTMVNLGEVYLLLNRTDSASYYLSRCYEFFKKVKNNSALYYIDTQLIALALNRNDLPLARKRLKEAVVPNFIEPNMVRIRNRYLQHYFEQSGDFDKAYHYLQENRRMDDSIRNERVKMRSEEIALRYRHDSTLMKKEVLIQQKENEVLRLSRWMYMGSTILLVLLAGISAIMIYRKRKRDEIEQMMRTAMTSQRLKNIRNRITPHFVFNVLNREIYRRRSVDDSRRLNELVKLIRRNLELTDNLVVSLSDELDFVRTYIDLEEQTLQPGFEFQVNVSPEVDTDATQVPAMLLQIPVENAVKHALSGKEGLRRLWIEINKNDKHIEMQVCDNGGGFYVGRKDNGTGTGMKVLAQTIQLLNTYNSDPIVMTIDNVPVGNSIGCRVRFIIPLDYSYLLKRTERISLWKRFVKRLSLTMRKAQ